MPHLEYGTDRLVKLPMPKHILIRDMRRCPFLPGDSGYDRWTKDDDERLAQLSRTREELRIEAKRYLWSEDKTVRDMAIFIDWFFQGD